jgi:oligopeptide transport system substrate-binding protein
MTSHPMIGTIFLNRYHIDSILGQGGMGVVYRAHDRLLDRDVSIKILNKSSLGSQGRARLLHEARAAAQLNHPNIVTVYDAGESDDIPFIVMELVEGNSLHEKPPVGIDQILTVARQICQALYHAHCHNIVHRDLKPENVLMSSSDQVKLMDFGLARSLTSRLTAEGSIVGSVFYLAPELALGQAFDGRADLYALGVMLYEFTTGVLPFASEDPLSVISQHLHAPVVPPHAHNEHIPPALDALILSLMSKRAEDRPASAQVVQDALERIASGEGVAVPAAPVSLLDRIVRGKLIGREIEVSMGLQAWDQAVNGKCEVLLISGEPGIGKTRLVYELIALVSVRGAFVLTGNCYMEGSLPYAPVTQMIEAIADSCLLDKLPDLPNLLFLAPNLRARYAQQTPLPALEPQVGVQHVHDSFIEMLSALTSRAPVLIVLEDAHWADSGTLSLMRHIARRASALNLRLLLVMTYREYELDEARPLNQVLYDFNREHLSKRMKLGRLDREQTDKLLEAILAEEISCEFLDGIYQETEGNPFFIEEVCKALIEQGELLRENGHWCLPAMEEIEIPQSIKVAIQARLARLPASGQETLRIASIIGREFDFETLNAISELDEDLLLEALESARRAQLISELRPVTKTRPSASPVFTFVHALIASTLRDSIGSLRRKRLHQRAALALEQLNPDRLDALAPQLGQHFFEAGDWKRAADYLLRAGDLARQVFTYPEAIEYYQRALLILKNENDFEEAAHTLMKLGLLYHSTLDFTRSRQAYQEGFALWTQAGVTPPTVLSPATRPLRLAWTDPLTLDPSYAFEAESVPIIEQLFVGLVSLTPDMNVAPELAQRWEVLENGRKYLFSLREDAKWTDGAPVTAQDFEFAWKRILDPHNCSRNHVLLYDIRNARDYYKGRLTDQAEIGVRALDARTLEVELEQPTGYFLHLLTYAATYPVPSHIVQVLPSVWTDPRNIVTNGPFYLESWQTGEGFVLSRNPEYIGRFGGNLQRVEITSNLKYPDFSSQLAAYESDQLDVCSLSGLLSESNRVRQRHAAEYVSIPNGIVSLLVFESTSPPFADVRVRRAFVQALDREALADECLQGYAAPATAGMVPPGLPGHFPESGLPYSPDQARLQLAEAGFPNGKGFPVVEVWLIEPQTMNMVEFIHDQWLENLCVESRWDTMKPDMLYRRLGMEKHPHVFMNGWLADYPDPDSYLRVGVAYQSPWRDRNYFQLVEEAKRVTSQTQRIEMYREAERILIREAPIMPIIYGRYQMLIKPRLRRIPISPIQSLILKDVILEE